MDITLERILSLLPKKDDGKFVRGAKKNFAMSLGYDSGDIVSMWINGSSASYHGKLHEISDKYNVSVEWLKGETDIREKLIAKSDEQLLDSELIMRLCKLTPEELQQVDAFVQGLLAAR